MPVVVAVLFIAPARTETANAGPNPQNVGVTPKAAGTWFARWSATPAAAAAARTTQRRQRSRTARKVRPARVATIPTPAQTQAAEPTNRNPGWPDATATAGQATLVPITVKTVREMATPVREMPVVSQSELNELDLAARPPAQSPVPPPPSTDGRAAPESEVTESSPIFAMAETWRTATQSAWFEPLLLAFAGALAAMSAIRVFA